MSHALFDAPAPTNEPIRAYAPGSIEKRELKSELDRQRQTPVEIPLVIDGNHIMTKNRRPVTSPHNKNLVLAHCAQATSEDAQAAVKAALHARKSWAALPWEDRAAVFLKAADLLATKYRAKMNAATMLGQSKTCFQSEIDAACELIDFFRWNVHFMTEIYAQQPYSPAGQWNRLSARPLEGFVYAVAPFNFTSISVNLPCAPALMGCAVVWKPAATGALSSFIGMQILEEAGLPPGVINFLPGEPGPISDALMEHPDLAGIHFTGSTATFNHLWKTVGNNIDKYKSYPRLVGETGGKDFVFAHPSADVDQLVTALVRGAFEYQGQKCSAASRAYIPKSIWPHVRDKMVAITEELKMGDVEDFTNFMGAVIDERAFKKIKGHIDHAKSASDAKVIAGGQCDDSKGWFIRPTVIETTNPKFKTMVEEIFGPVLTVYVYEDSKFEETLKLCDEGTPYALTGAVFARERRVIHHMAAALENAAGNFYINDKPTGAVVGQQPFGGARASGTNDKAGSMLNLLRWVSMRTIKENFLPITEHRYPHMLEP
ncbi:L-glutamate gamma-semialdehyde dehydrogenase [bacterium]|nr:L-glutamate gamma-semialdehyde dehydrogenase [bacterium]